MTDISNVHQGLLDYIERDLRLLTLKHNEKSINPSQISKNQLPVITPNPINQLPVITPNPINQLPVITPNPYLNKTILESNLPKKELKRETAIEYYVIIKRKLNETILEADPKIETRRRNLYYYNYDYEIICIQILNMRNQLNPIIMKEVLSQYGVSQTDYDNVIKSYSFYELSALNLIKVPPLLEKILPSKECVKNE